MQDKIEKITKIVKDELYRSNSQKYHHSLRMAEIALDIAKNENFNNLDLVTITSLLHDISPNVNSRTENAAESAIKAKKILEEFLDKNEIEQVYETILATEKKEISDTDLLGKILHDANIIDLLGMTGILRVAYNMGKENDSDSVAELPNWFESYSMKNLSFLELDYSKKLAERKMSEIKKSGN